MTILLNCCYLNIIPVVEGLQENDCYVHFRTNDTGAANYEVVERRDQSNANDVKQDSQENDLYSIVDKNNSGKYINSKVFFYYFGIQNMLLLTKYLNELLFLESACYLIIANHQVLIKIFIEGYLGVNRVIHDVIPYKH
jgi:hypothetical protein